MIEREAFTAELFAEIMPLAQKCWRECTDSKGESCAFYGERDYDIEPDFEAYLRLQSEGLLAAVALREGGVLKGYAIGFVYRCLHHKHILGGICDSFYTEPDYRDDVPEGAGGLMDKTLGELAALKAGIIGWPTIPGGYVHRLLKARGFVRDDIVMEKRI